MSKILFGLVTVLTLLAVAVPALAAPPGNGLEQIQGVTCNGEPVDVVTATNGTSFWIGEQHYTMTSFTGTFTPTGGDSETFSQSYGQKRGLAGPAITCTGSDTSPDGTFEFVVTAVPVPPGG